MRVAYPKEFLELDDATRVSFMTFYGAVGPDQRLYWQRNGVANTPLTNSKQLITTFDHYILDGVARSPQFGLIQDNPAAHVPKPNPQNERDRIARGDEWARVLGAAAPHLQRILIVLYALGPRRGELLRLEWSDVDMHRREFTLRNTKNGETRTVPMTPDVYRIFTELWQERRLDTQRVFLYNDKPIRDMKTACDKACRRAGIRNLRLHDLRHTASTNLRRAGVDATTAMKSLDINLNACIGGIIRWNQRTSGERCRNLRSTRRTP